MCKTYATFGEWVRKEHTVYSPNKTSDSVRAHLSFLPHEDDFLVPARAIHFSSLLPVISTDDWLSV